MQRELALSTCNVWRKLLFIFQLCDINPLAPSEIFLFHVKTFYLLIFVIQFSVKVLYALFLSTHPQSAECCLFFFYLKNELNRLNINKIGSNSCLIIYLYNSAFGYLNITKYYAQITLHTNVQLGYRPITAAPVNMKHLY